MVPITQQWTNITNELKKIINTRGLEKQDV
jgi:hypothetical protein